MIMLTLLPFSYCFSFDSLFSAKILKFVQSDTLKWKNIYLLVVIVSYQVLSHGSAVKNPPLQWRAAGDVGLIPVRVDPLEDGMATHSIILAGESHRQKSLAAKVQRVAKSWTWLSDLKCKQQVLGVTRLFHIEKPNCFVKPPFKLMHN